MNPHSTIEIRTAEDAQQQFLRGFITEQEMRDVMAAHGVLTIAMPPRGLERPDGAFVRRFPEDLIEEPVDPARLETRLQRVSDLAEQREAATKAAEKIEADAKPEVDIAVLQNRAATKAAEKVDVTPLVNPDKDNKK